MSRIDVPLSLPPSAIDHPRRIEARAQAEITRRAGFSPNGPGAGAVLDRINGCLSALSSQASSLLKPYLTEISLREGEILWDSGKRAADVYFPVTGLISMVVPVSDGIAVEVGSIGREAAAGTIFEPSQSGLCTQGQVQLGGSFIRIAAPDLMGAAKQSGEIQSLIAYCRDWVLMQAQQTAACNATHSADKRVCRWLFQASERTGADTVYSTQETIASLLAIRRTTLTLIAQKLQADRVIQYRRGKIALLDRARLGAAACECCNSLARRLWPAVRLLARTPA